MKKIFALVCTAALMTSFVACGPSEEEKKKMDSILDAKLDAESDHFADSVAKAMEEMNNASDTTKKDSAK